MPILNRDRVISEIAARDGIRIEAGDPIFALVTATRLGLEESVSEIRTELRRMITEFGSNFQRLETRAGRHLAQEVKESVREVRNEIQSYIHTARLNAPELVYEVHQAHRRPALLRWVAVGLVCGAILFLCGVWVGRMTVLGWASAGFRGGA